MLLNTRALCVRSVNAVHVLLIPGVEYFILNEGKLKFEPPSTCHGGCDTKSRKQLNQKYKLIIKALARICYIL